MNSLVEYKYKEPTVSTRRIAEEFEQKHTYLMELLESHKAKLEVFGVVRFETHKPKTGRPQKIAELTEPQILLLLTYTRSRKRTDELRIKLISDFMIMKDFINKQVVVSAISKQVRKSLTDAVEESGEQERMHNHGFSTYTLMVYKFLGIKKDYQDWKKSTGGKGDYRKTLPVEMRERIATAETLVKGMLELQKQHSEIKSVLEPLFKVKEIG
jgi:phage regulator Rha-like protein